MEREAARRVVIPDIGRPRMAKVGGGHVQKPDIATLDDWKRELGRCVELAVGEVGWSHKELIAAIEAAGGGTVDEREVGRWFCGERRAQWDRLFIVEPLRRPLVVRLARLGGAEVTTEIRFPARRSA